MTEWLWCAIAAGLLGMALSADPGVVGLFAGFCLGRAVSAGQST